MKELNLWSVDEEYTEILELHGSDEAKIVSDYISEYMDVGGHNKTMTLCEFSAHGYSTFCCALLQLIVSHAYPSNNENTFTKMNVITWY